MNWEKSKALTGLKRDFLIDLYFLQKRGFDIEAHLPEARRKEAAFDTAMISYLPSQITLDEVPEYILEPFPLAEFATFLGELRKTAADFSFPDDSDPASPVE